ncbi:MAG: TonB C-terminal domain-containing protein, partial [Deltaproteobacteria bacterium]|nr:TonB C-terminal domain-containing protein [Deltaproteobacteria bacterium]
PEANGAADLEAPELPPAADEATVAPPTAEQPPPAAPEKPADATPPRLEVPGLKLPEAPRETPQPPAALENLPGLPDAPQAPESFSGKESLSPPPAPGQEQQAPQSASEHQSGGLTPPTLGEGETQPDTMQRIRKRVEDINLRVESLPPRQTGIPSAQKEEQSLLALRIFSNRVREAVKENYTFPGGFPPELRTRVRVVLNRDGTVKEAKVIQPSGNPRFDQLVCLASIHKARFPHVPAEVDGEEIPFNITCAP